jgi:hypothetical protein
VHASGSRTQPAPFSRSTAFVSRCYVSRRTTRVAWHAPPRSWAPRPKPVIPDRCVRSAVRRDACRRVARSAQLVQAGPRSIQLPLIRCPGRVAIAGRYLATRSRRSPLPRMLTLPAPTARVTELSWHGTTPPLRRGEPVGDGESFSQSTSKRANRGKHPRQHNCCRHAS